MTGEAMVIFTWLCGTTFDSWLLCAFGRLQILEFASSEM